MASTELHLQPQSASLSPSQDSGRRQFPVTAALLLVLVAASFLVRVWPVSTSRYWDETVYLQNAEVICCGRTNYSELASRPPLLSLTFALLFRVWHSIYAASVITALLNAAAPLFLFLIGRRLTGKLAAALAAIMLAFVPFFVNAGNTLLTDTPALTFILICFWMLVEGAEEKALRWFAAAGFMGALAVLMRFASLPTIAVLGLICLRPQRRILAVLNFAAGFAVGLAPYLIWSRLRYGGFFWTLRHGWANVANTGDTAYPATYYLRNFPEIFSWLAVAGLSLWLILKVFRLDRHAEAESQNVPAPGGAQHRYLRWLFSWDAFLWAWMLVVLSYYMAIPHKEQRYILPLAPPVLLLACQGLAKLLQLRPRAARFTAAAILLIAFGYTCAPDFARFRGPFISPYATEEKEVSDYLKSVVPPSSVLYANVNYPVFAYYTGLPTRVLLEQGDRFYSAFPDLMPDDGYFILYRDRDLDPHMDWVDSNPHFRRLQEFPSLLVYEYHRKAD